MDEKILKLQEMLQEAWSFAYEMKMDSEGEMKARLSKVVTDINEVEFLITDIKNNKPS